MTAAAEQYRPPARALGKLIRLETRMAWREPSGLLLGLALPVFFLVVFGTVPVFRNKAPGEPRLTLFAYYVPVWITLAVSLIALITLPIPLVRDREIGWLRRVSTTPVPRHWLLAAHTVVEAVLALLSVAVVTIGGTAFFGMAVPRRPGGYVLAALLTIAAVFGLGLLVAALAPTSRAAGGIGGVILYPLLFFGGMWIPRENMAPALRTISEFTPLNAAGQAMRDAMLGSFPAATDLLVMLGWAVVCGAAAIRFFRWE